jgi:hypothetical protein
MHYFIHLTPLNQTQALFTPFATQTLNHFFKRLFELQAQIFFNFFCRTKKLSCQRAALHFISFNLGPALWSDPATCWTKCMIKRII